MKEIKLSQRGKNKDKFVALVDDEDFEYLNQWNWCAAKNGNTYYVQRSIRTKDKIITVKMHRVIMNTPNGIKTDHRDRNGLHCERHNLRNCTNAQNGANRQSWGRSKYLGVTYQNGKIKAQIQTNGKTTHLGYYKTEELAAKAYDTKAQELFGEFANLNFKEPFLNKAAV